MTNLLKGRKVKLTKFHSNRKTHCNRETLAGVNLLGHVGQDQQEIKLNKFGKQKEMPVHGLKKK